MNQKEISKKAKELKVLLEKAIKLSSELTKAEGVLVFWGYETCDDGNEDEYSVAVYFQPPTPTRKALVDIYNN